MKLNPMGWCCPTGPGSEMRAAGGVGWRRGSKGALKVLLVHRDRYDDWSFPKGKLDPGETHHHAALREVEEETGLRCKTGDELPEVQALVHFLGERTDGLVVTGVELGSISVLKTFTPPPQALVGAPVDGVSRHGKFVDIDCGGTHLVFHLARAGWLRWSDAMPATVLRPGKSPIALRVRFDDASGFDLTEAGTKKRLAAYVVNDPATVPGIASLGPDPLADEFTLEGREIFLHLPHGAGRSKLNLDYFERVLGVRATQRNWNTLLKLLELSRR